MDVNKSEVSESLKTHFRPILEESQLLPPSLLLFFLAFLNTIESIFGYTLPNATRGALLTVAVVAVAAILIERAMDRGFRFLESRTEYGEKVRIEKSLKSTLFLGLAVTFYSRPGLETLVSSSVVFVGIALLLNYYRSFNENSTVLFILDVLIVFFVSAALLFLLFGVEMIS